MSFVTVPSFPTMPDGLLSTCDQAEVLRDLCNSGPMSVRQGAAVLKIPKQRALHLKAIWGASGQLQTFIHRHRIAPTPAGLLARIEEFEQSVAQRMAGAYLRREVTTGGLRELLDHLVQRNEGHEGGQL
ncbi:hypothetical protein ACFL6C_01230 [Myxococcota bacterium]